jgi:hypothetical protein
MNIIWLTLEKTNTWMIPYAHWSMSSNKWIYILGIYCEDKLHVSKESDSLIKNKEGIIQREVGNSLKLKCKASCGN